MKAARLNPTGSSVTEGREAACPSSDVEQMPVFDAEEHSDADSDEGRRFSPDASLPENGGHSHGSRGRLPPSMTLSESEFAEASLRSHEEEDEYCVETRSDRGGEVITDFADILPPPPPPEEDVDVDRNLFRTSYAGRPIGMQGPAHQTGELGLQWLSVMKSIETAVAKVGDGWSERIQVQKYQMEENQQQQRQSYVEQEAERARMNRTDHRHALQQLVVEAFRWRRVAAPQQLSTLDEDSSSLQIEGSRTTAPFPSQNASMTSPTMKHVPSSDSVESFCGLTVEEDEVVPQSSLSSTSASPVAPNATGSTASSFVPPQASTAAPTPAAAAAAVVPQCDFLGSTSESPPRSGSGSSSHSTASSTLSACNRQAWRRQFPLPPMVPGREKADHTSSPLDVADRSMLYGVLDDIDSVMTTSDLGEDGLPKDRYNEVLANLQFLGLFRPKYADDVSDDEEDNAASVCHVDLGFDDDEIFDLPSSPPEDIDGLLRISDA